MKSRSVDHAGLTEKYVWQQQLKVRKEFVTKLQHVFGID
jgi:hypothetical protein